MNNEIYAKCMGISMKNSLRAPYNGQECSKLYSPGGYESSASHICHYCSSTVLKAIVEGECLRFSDVRFLNDSTEFQEILEWIKSIISQNEYMDEFRKLILESEEMKELESYKQLYVQKSKKTGEYEQKVYRTYTCSFSEDEDSLNMWNYYATSEDGVSVIFDHAGKLFNGSLHADVNIQSAFENGIHMQRGLVLYQISDKKNCIAALLNELQEIYQEVQSKIDEYKNLILWSFKEAVNNMRCFFKNDNFAEEKEYRIVLKVPEEIILNYKKNKNEDDIVDVGQFKRGNVLIPYIDYKIHLESIKEIVLNPYIKDEKSMFGLGIKELLWRKKLEQVSIQHSTIPMRKY